jgi:hypothetical protein
MVYILPYVEQTAIYNNLWPLFQAGKFLEGGNPGVNSAGTPIKMYYCPSDPRGMATDLGDWYSTYQLGGPKPVAMTDYVGVGGIDVGASVEWGTNLVGGNNWPMAMNTLGIFNNGYNSATTAGNTVSITQILDGTSNTMMVGERPYITPGPSGSYNAAADGLSWSGFSTYWDDCGPCYSAPMGYYIYSGQLTRDTVSGVNNSTQIVAGNMTGGSCGSGPFYYGKGPNNVQNACSFNYIWSNHIGGSLFLMGDGSVRMVNYSVSTTTLNAASTYAGGEVLAADW